MTELPTEGGSYIRDPETGARAVEAAAWAGVTEAEVDAARLARLGLGRNASLEEIFIAYAGHK